MASKIMYKTVNCPLRNRVAEVTYRLVGNWLNRDYDILSCPAMVDEGGCDRRCKQQLADTRTVPDWNTLR